MIDKEIIKALECCKNDCSCAECPYELNNECNMELCMHALDLIKRQQTEIERLTNTIEAQHEGCLIAMEVYKNNAIKEFAERLKQKYGQKDILCPRTIISMTQFDLDDFAKEMVGYEDGFDTREWKNAECILPEEEERVLVCCKTKKGVRSINLAYQTNGTWHGNGSMSGVTHWQYLPELPEED